MDCVLFEFNFPSVFFVLRVGLLFALLRVVLH